ncbi:hypothetical protein [Burkholderia sp. ABCPW 14]|uniref:hypothetical protein n=1 Tax=Burkholderia sp. ABCPW 14 TaxID=1637860 RepID=UPI0009E88D0A|nr:hypothetical protein [Burkholderia sp. ABCPW 14]
MGAILGSMLGGMTKDTMEGIAFSKATTKLSMLTETQKAENDLKKTVTKMVAEGSKPAQ